LNPYINLNHSSSLSTINEKKINQNLIIPRGINGYFEENQDLIIKKLQKLIWSNHLPGSLEWNQMQEYLKKLDISILEKVMQNVFSSCSKDTSENAYLGLVLLKMVVNQDFLLPKSSDATFKDLENAFQECFFGIKLKYFDKIPLDQWIILLDVYKQVPDENQEGELTEADLKFFKIYSQIFSDRYYSKGEISGYQGYTFKRDFLISRVNSIIEILDIYPKSKILDFGCAKGFYVSLFNELGFEAKGIDISEYAINAGLSKTKDNLYVLNSLHVLEFLKNENFEFILLKDVLEHIPSKILSRFWNTIKTLGKRVLVVVPITDLDGSFINFEDENDISHLIRWTYNEWMEFFRYDASSSSYKSYPKLNLALKGNKSKGTLLVCIDIN